MLQIIKKKNKFKNKFDFFKEQYGHILLAINSSNPVANASQGFQNVKDHINADYAFIHDSAEVKYEISRSCELIEVGEVFAEQPYSLAIQQGSQLQVKTK